MDSKPTLLTSQIKNKKKALLHDAGLISLTNIMESPAFQHQINHCRVFRERVFTPLVTLLLFIKQVLNPDKSCKKAQARWKLYGRELKAFDGTTVRMADTETNQESFPQHGEQKKGVGFPIARLLVVISLTVGTVIDYALGAYQGKGTGEQALLREVKASIQTDDIVLGDRNFPDYFTLADLSMKGADGIFKAHRHRKYDFRKGARLGKNDHVVAWKKPQRPAWMDQKTYDTYPSTLPIREFKVAGLVYVTTFLNAKHYLKRDLANIYKLRWHIEISLKNIKATMSMHTLSCKSPEMVRKEIGIHFLAYNVIRILIAEASQRHGFTPREISFKGAVQLLNSFMPYFASGTSKDNERMYARMLSLLVNNKIGNRPGRVEPRRVKQRGTSFKWLNKPRHIEKINLEKNIQRKVAQYAAEV